MMRQILIAKRRTNHRKTIVQRLLPAACCKTESDQPGCVEIVERRASMPHKLGTGWHWPSDGDRSAEDKSLIERLGPRLVRRLA